LGNITMFYHGHLQDVITEFLISAPVSDIDRLGFAFLDPRYFGLARYCRVFILGIENLQMKLIKKESLLSSKS